MNVDGNVAFKCTFHDGPHSPYGIGFYDVCTNLNIRLNIEGGRVWCNNSICRDYYDSDFEGKKPRFPCYESSIFTEWSFDSGVYHTGDKKNEPIMLRNAQEGKIAVMTTRPPGFTEDRRQIFAIMVISDIIPGDDNHATIIHFDKSKNIILNVNYWLNFWKYYKTATGSKIWGTGLFRYMTDKQISGLLRDVAHMDQISKKGRIAKDLLREM